MKKLFVVIAVAIVTAGSMQAQFKIGVRAGLNLTKQTWKSEGLSVTPDSKIGFQAGVVGDLSLSDAFAIQPSILFSQQGFKLKDGDATATATLNYIQVPINVQYKFDLGGVQLFPQVGPYLGYGFGGKAKYKEDGNTETVDIKFGSDKGTEANDFMDGDDYKPFDFGLGFGVGVQFAKSFQFAANYNLGLLNIDPAGSDDYKVKNNGFAFTLTYLFGK